MYRALTVLGLCMLLLAGSSFIAAEDSRLSEQSASIQPSPRIIGGFQTSIAQVPATVALLSKSRVQLDGDLFQAQFCGGTVIASRWVMTAAHCVVDLRGNITPPEAVLVLTGSSDLDNPVNQPIAVLRVIAHPEFRSVEQGRDIALLQLEFDALVQPIALDTLSVGIDEEAFIAGWGAVNTQEEGRSQSFPKQLRGAFVNMTPGTTCGVLFPDYRGFTDATTICAGVTDGGKDSCQGDSGGPLYRVDSAENRVSAITGITSWGISCGVATNPGIYTNVAAYVGWIQDNLRSNAPEQPATQPVPVNDGSGSTTPEQPVTPATDSDVVSLPDSSGGGGSSNNDDHVFTGALWMSLLPLFTLLLWRTSAIYSWPTSRNGRLGQWYRRKSVRSTAKKTRR